MTRFLRPLVDQLGKAFNVHIVRDSGIGRAFERAHLLRFLTHFEVDCVFDVGANSGQYARQLRTLGYRGPIISFEPIPALAAALRQRSAKDGLWFVEEAALDEAIHEVTFNVMAHSEFSSLKAPSSADTLVVAEMNRVVERVNLTTGTLEAFFRAYADRLHFKRPYLKMDTQGNDVAVARGAGAALTDFVGLQSELAIKKLYEHQIGYQDAIAYYTEMGFQLSALVPNNSGFFPDLLEVDCIMVNSRFHSPVRP